MHPLAHLPSACILQSHRRDNTCVGTGSDCPHFHMFFFSTRMIIADLISALLVMMKFKMNAGMKLKVMYKYLHCAYLEWQ